MNKNTSDTLEQLIHVPLFLAAVLILTLILFLPAEVALEHVYQPPYLSFALNTIFITAISFWIAWQTIRGYLASGFVPFLVLGCALLAAGSTAIVAGLLFDEPDGFNRAATVYTLGFLLSALLHFINACLLGGKEERVETAEGLRKLVSSLAYPAVFLAVGGIWAADYHALFPRFFNPGSGPTMIREVVHTATIMLLGIASYLLLNLARQRNAGYLRWYSFGLALIAVGFFGSAFG